MKDNKSFTERNGGKVVPKLPASLLNHSTLDHDIHDDYALGVNIYNG